MRKLVSFLILTLAAVPAFAVILPNSVNQVPEPEALSLLAIGGLAMIISRLKK